ncbi:hypothetical protein NPIL_52871 [Nephila pilipes]|uniref:Uncharacterized protein n=1 Tax=Nephila pilipes TaxID=299642 RepID=A0A8X6Q7T6_NEPPI|nr:hypothetical protein NPIL_52871 [Nephila pilipes]
MRFARKTDYSPNSLIHLKATMESHQSVTLMLIAPISLITESPSLASMQQVINSYLGMLKGLKGATLFLTRMNITLLSLPTSDLTKTHAAYAPYMYLQIHVIKMFH